MPLDTRPDPETGEPCVLVDMKDGTQDWVPVRRVAFALAGKRATADEDVINTCDHSDVTEPCINPDHLVAVPRGRYVVPQSGGRSS